MSEREVWASLRLEAQLELREADSCHAQELEYV
jgi:hypothetical protein